MTALPNRHIPGDINICTRFIRNALDLSIGHDAVATTERLGGGNVVITSEANESALEARGANKCCGAKTCLGGCGADYDLLRTKPLVLHKQIGNHVASHKQRKKCSADPQALGAGRALTARVHNNCRDLAARRDEESRR